MPERGFATEIWDSDEWFQDLSLIQRYLFIYLWTNNHCNQAGLYHITMKTISDESLIPRNDLPELLNSLEPKAKWYPEQNIVWVKDFIKKQSKSPKFIAAAARSLLSINNNGAISELLQYYQQVYSISIPYQYYIHKLSILTRASGPHPLSSASAISDKGRGGGKTEKLKISSIMPQSGNAIPASESESEESLSSGDREIISTWRSVKGFIISPSDASELVDRLRKEFPDVDILGESKRWAVRKLSEPLTQKSRPSSQLWNWMCKAREFKEEKNESGSRPKQERARGPITHIRGYEQVGPEDEDDLP
jgi:hypothetical protein